MAVVLALENTLAERILKAERDESAMARADRRVVESLYRLAAVMDEPEASAYLGKHIRSEVIFYLLCGSSGRQFLRSAVSVRQAEEIYEANSWIKENFRTAFTVEELAAARNMSVSLFHQKFKSAVGMGPIQCQKRLRLTESRRLMLDGGLNASEVSGAVGYESVQQFTRDYRKMFGKSPREDIGGLREQIDK